MDPPPGRVQLGLPSTAFWLERLSGFGVFWCERLGTCRAYVSASNRSSTTTPFLWHTDATFVDMLLQIRNMVKQVQRETWSTPTDALDLVSELKDMAGCYVKWDTDELHRLKHVFWSTGQQQVFARQWGGIVLQDNTALTNRCFFSCCP